MVEPARELDNTLLGLPPKERARLAERLISSLDQESDFDAEKLWLEEAERRLDELESGLTKAVSSDDLQREVRSKLR
ncbi:MAG: addiction module protein [Chloroflexi bacterium]|nr:addiction module protein [Chloroflexota bacterium]